ncbi:MAG: diacylglycerol kinase family lipid kinase [Bacteroidales bacterium]|nr:diacylglycerol kinase family lipid kinase [Bacteroidales bacterium]
MDILPLFWNVIINPKAFKGKSLNFWSKLRIFLWEKGLTLSVWDSPSIERCEEIIKLLLEKKQSNFMVVGGDGTLNEVVNALIRNKADLSKIYLAVVPSGTGNDWARTHNISKSPLKLAEMFTHGMFIKHDVGKITVTSGKEFIERYFINIAGLGFDAEVILRVLNSKEYRYGSRFIYLKNLLLSLKHHKTIPCHFIFDNIEIDVPVFSIAAGICKYNGNGMKQVPMAVHDDGLLDIVYIEKMNLFEIMTQLPRLFLGTHVGYKKVHHIRTANIQIHPQNKMYAETEGEIVGTGSFAIECISSKINVLTDKKKNQSI